MSFSSSEQISRSKETETLYETKFEYLSNQFERESGKYYRDDQDGFALFLDNKRKNVTENTWRLYRSAVNFIFPSASKKIIEVLNQKGGIKKNRSKKTSGNKAKKVTEQQLNVLLAKIIESRSQYKEITVKLIQATLLTGVRPSEWRSAKLIDRKLIIKNAKQSNGRSHGAFRTLNLEMFNDDEFHIISYVVNIMYGSTEYDIETLYGSVTKLIKRYAKGISKKNISLYSFRHQFSANMKKYGYSKYEVAALMGHIDKEMAGRNYGKKRGGNGISRPPLPEKNEVERVSKQQPDYEFNPEFV